MNKISPFIKIKNRLIGEKYEPVIIAEIGINHGGSLKVALNMAEKAIDAGADIIKHQTHIVTDEMTPDAKKVIPAHTNESIYEIMENFSLNENEEITLKEFVESKGCIFLSTPFSRAAADRLQKMNVDAFKIGSGECNNYPLIEHIARFRKPMIVSTGMNNIESIKITVDILNNYEIPFALLHTTNIYPTPSRLVRLGAFKELKDKFNNNVIGLSDHTTSNLACLASVALGASILERHFTDTMKRDGPDIVNSMDPKSLKELSISSKEIHLMRGGSKIAAEEEKDTINFAFASVVSIKDIKKGELFTEHNLWVKRPGNGELLASDYKKILGKKSQSFIKANSQIKKSDILNF
tara:strand:+ start:227 stop:1282 length:1056 start_codon:yes stop_codon:yes gene_type:complete